MLTSIQNMQTINHKSRHSSTPKNSSKENKHISKPATNSYEMPSPNLMKVYFAGIKNEHKNNYKTTFRGKPWDLNLYSLGISSYGQVSGSEAIKAFDKFKLGNYLDISHPSVWPPINEPSYKHIRKENLSFLDRVTNLSDKREFINHYKALTGFPDLGVVSSKIRSEFVNSINRASAASKSNSALSSSYFDVLKAGYDDTCSVGKGKALPGSDIDKAYIIIRGGDYDSSNTEAVNHFKGSLWNTTDQRILSYNHDTSFPQIYTEKQVNTLFEKVDEQTYGFKNCRRPWWDVIFGVDELPHVIVERTDKYNRYLSVKDYFHDDYEAANPFFIELCSRFPARRSNELDISNPSKENIKNFGFFIETMREGSYFTAFGNEKFPGMRHDAYQLTNLAQLSALNKNHNVTSKPKIIARENLINNFDNWPTDKQFDFIKTTIKTSCEDNETYEFPEYFQGADIRNKFENLFKRLRGE